jgi:hypothetical protein
MLDRIAYGRQLFAFTEVLSIVKSRLSR